ncbi:MAG: xanthine dehydrogenase family protein molybdopterin-binding subunit [Methylovirgula sp.]
MLMKSLAQRVGLPFDQLQLSRRGFLIGATAVGSSLVVGFAAAAEGPAGAPGAINPFDGYVKIDPDNHVTVYSAHMDMGQGIYFGVATLVQEELDADWAKLTVDGGFGNDRLYGNIAWGGKMQGTGGSTGTFSSWERYRKAGATARSMLIAAAAAAWSLPAAEITAKKGVLSHASGKSARYGEMAAAAARLPVPQTVALKARKDWIYIGDAALPRYDSAPKADGRQNFTIDVRLPEMLTAVMIHPPRFGATLKSFDASKAKKVKGVVDVVAIPRGIAVLATGMWEAMQGRAQVTAEWDESEVEGRSSADILAAYRAAADKGGEAVAKNMGNVDAAFAAAAGKIIEARYEFPYLAHAALEPLNAVARMNADGTLEVWGGHQMPDIYQAAAAKVAGIAPDKVVLHVMKTGGGFGRRAVADADIIVEAVGIAKAIGWKAPVKVQWAREDDMRGGRYRPAYVHKLQAVFDKEGELVGLQDTIVGQSIMKGTPMAAGAIKNGVDATSVEGMANQPYAIPNFRVDLTSPESKVPVLWWRSVGSTHTAYALECFMDELAEAAGKDALAFRLALLQQKPRHAAVLKLAAEKAGWGKPLPAGHALGLALAESFKTYVAQVAEVSIEDKKVKVHRVTCALDCGVAVNPDQVKAQMEGGIGFGLGAILKSQITFERGKVVQGNFDTYDVLHLNEMPQVEVYIVPSDEHPTGVGEPGVPPIGPAVANAVYRINKKRIRSLPFSQA